VQHMGNKARDGQQLSRQAKAHMLLMGCIQAGFHWQTTQLTLNNPDRIDKLSVGSRVSALDTLLTMTRVMKRSTSSTTTSSACLQVGRHQVSSVNNSLHKCLRHYVR
jgi:hypothetical protein